VVRPTQHKPICPGQEKGEILVNVCRLPLSYYQKPFDNSYNRVFISWMRAAGVHSNLRLSE
jgi:hypothetical protein